MSNTAGEILSKLMVDEIQGFDGLAKQAASIEGVDDFVLSAIS